MWNILKSLSSKITLFFRSMVSPEFKEAIAKLNEAQISLSEDQENTLYTQSDSANFWADRLIVLKKSKILDPITQDLVFSFDKKKYAKEYNEVFSQLVEEWVLAPKNLKDPQHHSYFKNLTESLVLLKNKGLPLRHKEHIYNALIGVFQDSKNPKVPEAEKRLIEQLFAFNRKVLNKLGFEKPEPLDNSNIKIPSTASSPRTLKKETARITQETMENRRYFTVAPPSIKGLVLSGGGAKGIAYSGMITALNKNGDLAHISHVSGASAGAMTASLLAVGMSPENMDKLVSQLQISKLLDRPALRVRAKGYLFRNMFDLIYMVQIKEHLNSIKPEGLSDKELHAFDVLTNKVDAYEGALHLKGLKIKNVDDVIALANSSNRKLKNFDAAMVYLDEHHNRYGNPFESAHFTLGDLGLLREVLPPNKKYLIKNLSLVVTNQDRNSLERYNEVTTPTQPLAQVVQWSGAHPALFNPGVNAKGEAVADGGILDNMPEIAGLNHEQVLCVKAETGAEYEERVKKAQESTPKMVNGKERVLGYITKKAIGGSITDAMTILLNREKVFYHNGNMLFINTGEITTTNTSPTFEQIEVAKNNGEKQTEALLEDRKKQFTHPLIAALYVGDKELKKIMVAETEGSPLITFGLMAQVIMFHQKQIVIALKTNNMVEIREHLKDINTILEGDLAHMTLDQRKEAINLYEGQINFMSEGKFAKLLENEKARENTPEGRIRLPSLTLARQPIHDVRPSSTSSSRIGGSQSFKEALTTIEAKGVEEFNSTPHMSF